MLPYVPMYGCFCVHHEGDWGSSSIAPLILDSTPTAFICVMLLIYSQEGE
jgi:hypothetical protein